MKLLLIVGSANDIFIYNYAKWLKKSMDVTIDVFEFYPSKQQGYDYKFYECVGSAGSIGVPKIKSYVDPYYKAWMLKSFLEGKYYDIIHCHWIVSPLVLVKNLKMYCSKLVITFWGREYDNMKLLNSNNLFRKHLDKFIKDVDARINDAEAANGLKENHLHFNGLFYSATLGSAPLEALYNIMQSESREASKIKYGFPKEKLSVLIGYSGKAMHQHIAIINELSRHNELKEKLHLFAPMTRGANSEYIEKVKKALENSGYSHTIISGRFLSDKELAQARNATDIALQLTLTDGFSRSVIECFCAKSIVIYGEWLGYQRRLESNGFEGICVKSIEDCVNQLPEILTNISKYDAMLQTNYQSGRTKYLWSICIKDWVNAYNNILSKQ